MFRILKLSVLSVGALLASGCGAEPQAEEDSPPQQECREAGQIGPNGKYHITASCCDGLALMPGQYFEYEVDGQAYCYADLAPTPVSYCLPCGDGVCDEYYEDSCLCPDDCGAIPQENYRQEAPPPDAS